MSKIDVYLIREDQTYLKEQGVIHPLSIHTSDAATAYCRMNAVQQINAKPVRLTELTEESNRASIEAYKGNMKSMALFRDTNAMTIPLDGEYKDISEVHNEFIAWFSDSYSIKSIETQSEVTKRRNMIEIALIAFAGFAVITAFTVLGLVVYARYL